jgi:hypothetical protein
MTDVKILIGFASEQEMETDVIGRSARVIPFPEMEHAERVFVTMQISQALLDDPDLDRAQLADAIAANVSDKVHEIILQGPRVTTPT